MPKRILSVSYDISLLHTRERLLENEGYRITSVETLNDAIGCCEKNGFDLFIIGHSIPDTDKKRLIRAFRDKCPSPVLALRRGGEGPMIGADYYAFPYDPVELIQNVKKILSTSA